MKHSIARYLEGQQKVYRFALYGRSAAGKTCLLAALNLSPLFPHPAGYTCCRLSQLPGVLRPAGEPASWDLRSNPVAAFYSGSEKLAEAEDALRQGNIPPGTDKQPPYLMLYEFTCPRRGTIRVEVIDYAGELTDPQLTNEDLAILLRKHLKRMDGIIILAEAPRPGEEQAELPRELRKLQESFAMLQGELRQGGRWNAPVALVINKWDRRGKLRATPEEREIEIDEFLNPPPASAQQTPPPHRFLANALLGLVTEGNFKVFAASAFGASRIESVDDPAEASGATGRSKELPARPTPFASYGLEDPFVWVARRRDDIDLTDYRERRSGPALLRWLNPLRPDSPWRWTAAARRLLHQLPEGTPERKEAGWGLFWNPLMGVSRLIVALVLLVAGWGLWEALLIDGPEYHRVSAILDDREATLEEQDWAEKWLHDYGNTDPYRHYLSQFLVLDRNRALDIRSERLATRDDLIWSQVQDRKADPPGQQKLAEEYLKRYPNGKRAAEAEALATLAETERKTAVREQQNRQNLTFFIRIHTRLKEAKNLRDLKVVAKDLEGGMPYPEAADKTALDRQVALHGLLAATRERLQEREDWDFFAERYHSAMQNKQLLEAARLLATNPNVSEEVRKLKTDFRLQSLAILKRQQLEYREAGAWPRALEILEAALQDPNLISLLEAGERLKINELVRDVKAGWGQQLYAEFRKGRTIEDANRYLELPVDQRMAPVVQRYRNYLEKMAHPQDLTIKLTRIEWGDWWNDYRNRMGVWMDGEKLFGDGSIRSRKRGTTTNAGEKTVRKKVTDKVDLLIQIWNVEGTALGYKRPAGKKEYTGTLLNLNDRLMDLEDDNGPSKGARVHFEVSGIPVAPELPGWKD